MKRNVMNVENTGAFELSKAYRTTINQTRMPSFFVFFSEEAVASAASTAASGDANALRATSPEVLEASVTSATSIGSMPVEPGGGLPASILGSPGSPAGGKSFRRSEKKELDLFTSRDNLLT